MDKVVREKARAFGGKNWEVLGEIVNDNDFLDLLPRGEKTLLEGLKSTTNIASYQDKLQEIILKYAGWDSYSKSGLIKLKSEVADLAEKNNENLGKFNKIKETADFIGGAEVLTKYSESFKKTSDEHKNRADAEKELYGYSLVLFSSAVGVTLFFSVSESNLINKYLASDIKEIPLNAGVFALKATIILFFYQITSFLKRNYNAEKHLEEVYRHRSDVLQSLHSVYNVIDSREERDRILVTGAAIAYERGESGYITTKEGAGGNDVLENIIAKSVK